MADTPVATRIQAQDASRSIDTLTAAFAADVVMRWFWPDDADYAASFPGFAVAFGGKAFEHGTGYELEHGAAVALWLPPGVSVDGEAFAASVDDTVDPDRLAESEPYYEQMDRYHPTIEHWYLPLTGVTPDAQGRGLGSALLRGVLETCDQDGQHAYLEATSPGSRDLYARHGFDVLGEIQSGTIPPMWAMLREPR